MDSQQTEWIRSRLWLARSAAFLIAAFVLLIIGSAFRPVLPIAVGVGLISLYAIGRFAWHLQSSANARRRLHRTRLGLIARLMSEWPVPVGIVLSLMLMGIGLFLVEVFDLYR